MDVDARGLPLDPTHPWNSGSKVVPQKQPFSIPHYVLPSAIPVTLVCGPPGSGKTTFVRQHQQPGDLVIDLDDIREGLCGDRHSEDPRILERAFTIRDDLIHSLARRQEGQAWLVVAPSLEERNAWLRALGPKASLLMMDTGRDECHRRIDADPARRNHRQMLHVKVDAYFRSRWSA